MSPERVDLYDGTEPGREGVLAIARRALALKAGAAAARFPGKRLSAVFLNPSLRTRTSLEAACGALGVQPMVSTPGGSAWAWETRSGVTMDGAYAEHVQDAVQVLAGYADVLAVRAFASLEDADYDRFDPVLSAYREHSDKPVLNLESTRFHPLQGLADTATWVDRLGPDLSGKKLVLTWAPHPKALPAAVANQVLLSAALQGMQVTVAHPEGFDLDPQIVERARTLSDVEVVHDQDAAMADAQVVVAKSWSGFSAYGRRDAETEARAGLSHWMIDEATMAKTDDAGFMHCLPVRRNVVVSDPVLDGSWAIDTAHNRLWTAMAALERMLEGTWTP